MKRYNFGILILGLIILSGCASNEIANSGDVKQSTIYQSYSVNYDEAENTTEVFATFRFGGSNGTTLLLSPPSSVTFNGEAMKEMKTVISGAFYQNAWSKPLANSNRCEFIFTDTEGKKYTNSVKFNMLLTGPVPAEIKVGMPLEIPIKTPPLAYGESIRVSLRDTSHSEDFITERMDKAGTLLIPANVMGKLKGRVTIEIKRFANIKLKEATEEGGNMVFEYSLRPHYVTIVN